MNKRVIFSLWTMLALSLSDQAYAAVINHDYNLQIQQSDIRRYDSNSSYISMPVVNTPWLSISQGDTFTGTIKFAGGTTVNMLSNAGVTAQFLFSHSNVAYRFWSYASLLDDKGNELAHYRFFSSDVSSHFLTYPGAVQSYPITSTTPIAGMKFKIEFDTLYEWHKHAPVSVRLMNLTVGRHTSITSAVPEPSTWGMMLIGFVMTGIVSRKRRCGKEIVCA